MHPPQPTSLLAAVAAALLVSTTGCGAVRVGGHVGAEEVDWPLRPLIETNRVAVEHAASRAALRKAGVDVPGVEAGPMIEVTGADRPTALVRIALEPVGEAVVASVTQSEDRSVLLTPGLHAAPLSSGLFSAVTLQLGERHTAAAADFVLDVTLSRRSELRWTAVFGVLTLGALPIPYHHVFELRCALRDRELKPLQETRYEATLTDVVWLGFLPLNLLFTVFDPFDVGQALGLTPARWETDALATIDRLWRATLADLQDRIPETRPR